MQNLLISGLLHVCLIYTTLAQSIQTIFKVNNSGGPTHQSTPTTTESFISTFSEPNTNVTAVSNGIQSETHVSQLTTAAIICDSCPRTNASNRLEDNVSEDKPTTADYMLPFSRLLLKPNNASETPELAWRLELKELVNDTLFKERGVRDDYNEVETVKRCTEEMKNGVYWNETDGGMLAIRNCPPGYIGNIYRPCFASCHWGSPDYSECRLENLKQLRRLIGFHIHKQLIGGLKHLVEELQRYLSTSSMYSPMDRLESFELILNILRADADIDLEKEQDIVYIQTILHSLDDLFSRKYILFAYDSKKMMQMRRKVIDILRELTGYAERILRSLLTTKKSEIVIKSSKNIVMTAFKKLHSENLDNHNHTLMNIKYQIINIEEMGYILKKVDLALVQIRDIGSLLDEDTLHIVSDIAIVTSIPPLQYPTHRVHFHIPSNKFDKYSVLECGLLWNYSIWWNRKECSLHKQSSNEVICQCTQPGTIVVLSRKMYLNEKNLVNTSISAVMYLGCLTSTLFIFLTLAAHIVYFKKGPPDGSLILLNIFIPMITSQIVFMAGINVTQRQQLCYSVALTLHYLYLATSCWMVCYGVYLYRRLHSPLGVSSRLRDYCYFSWCLPIVLVLTSFLVNPRGYETEKYCWLSIHRGMLLSFIVPMTSLILINTILMLLVLKLFFDLRPITHKGEIKKTRIFLRAGVTLLPFFAVNWFLGVLALEDTSTLFFQYAFAITNSLQGFLVFVFFFLQDGEINPSVRRKIFKQKKKGKSGLKLKRSSSLESRHDSATCLLENGLISPPQPTMYEDPCCSKIRL